MLTLKNIFISPQPKLFSRNFSVFSKLKDFLKSGGQSSGSVAYPIEVENIKVQYDEEEKSMKNKKKLKKPQHLETQEEATTKKNEIIKYERDFKLIKRDQKEREIIEVLIAEINKENTVEHVKKTIKSKYKTIWEKMHTYDVTADGKIRTPEALDKDGKPRIFESLSLYLEWKENKEKEIKDNIFNKLTPMEFHITQGKATERPFTGDYWDTNKVGLYACKVCTHRIFSSTHKYNVKGLGHATFWNFLPFSLNFHDDHLEFPMPSQAIYQLQFANSHPVKRITCSNCDSHLGHVFNDGPAPFFKRLNINSPAIKFLDFGWYESPDVINKRRQLEFFAEQQKKIHTANTKIQRLKKEIPEVFDYINNNITLVEKNLNYTKLTENLDRFEEHKSK